MSLSPEIRQRIYEEERIRLEARERIVEEILLRRQGTAFLVKLLLVLAFFAVGYLASDYYLRQSQAVPETAAPAQPSGLQVSQLALDEIAAGLNPDPGDRACVGAAGRDRPQVRATIELAREVSRDAARRMALARAKVAGATLRQHGYAVPAYVEVVSPKRWYGMAVYDSDTLKITWDPCPGRCEQEGTQHVRRCRQ